MKKNSKGNKEQRCDMCDWHEDNRDARELLGKGLNLRLPSGEIGVFCSIIHKVKKKDGGKYCGNFCKQKSYECEGE